MDEIGGKTTGQTAEDELDERLSAAVTGLWYISETDAEIFPFTGSKSSAVSVDVLRSELGLAADAEIEERGFDEMLERYVSVKDWYNDVQRATASRWLALKALMTTELKDLKVFKVGDVRRDVYFVGLDAAGRLRGLKTFAVET